MSDVTLRVVGKDEASQMLADIDNGVGGIGEAVAQTTGSVKSNNASLIRSYTDFKNVVGDVYQAVKGIERKLQAGAVVAAGPAHAQDDDWVEPAEAVAALDALAGV